MATAPIRFTCFACGGNIRALSSQIGETVECPRCSATVVVPQPGAPQPAGDQRPASDSKMPGETASSRRRAAPADASQPLRIDELGAEAGEFTLTCPTCETRISATPAQIGQAITCPDCYSTVPVLPRDTVAPRETGFRGATTGLELSESEPPARAAPRVPENSQSPATAPSTAAADAASIPSEFTVSCPVCHTRVGARASQVGQNMVCPDCENEFTVRAPRQVPKQRLVLEEGEEFRLSDVVERPKYAPTTRGEVSRGDLDIVEFFEPSPIAETPTAPPARTAGRIDFFVACPTCGSKVGARFSQAGQRVRCSDCLTDVVVIVPADKARAAAAAPHLDELDEEEDSDIEPRLEPEAPPIAIAAPAAPPVAAVVSQPAEAAGERRSRDVMAEASRAAIERAESEIDAAAEEEAAKIDKLPPFQQLLSVLLDLAVIVRVILMSFVMLIELTLLKAYTELSGDAVAYAPVIVLAMVGLGVPLLGFGSAAIVAIVESTAVGQVRIVSWAESFTDSIWPTLQVIVALVVSSMPGMISMSIALSLGLHPVVGMLLLPLSMFFLFPFVFLSVLEGDHPFHIISFVVAQSIPRCFTAWLRYFGESLVLMVALWGLQLLIFAETFFVRILVAFGMLIVAALYFRSVGLLAFSCNQALMKRAEAEAERELAEGAAAE